MKNKTELILKIMIVVCILIIFTATNPTKEEYINWIVNEYNLQSDNFFEQFFVFAAGESFLSRTTTEKDYILFSIFNTYFDNHKLKTIGVFNKFILLNCS